MKKFSFIARVPDRPGALHKAAEIVSRYSGKYQSYTVCTGGSTLILFFLN